MTPSVGRRRPDTPYPRVHACVWCVVCARRRMGTLNGIIEQLRNEQCRAVLSVLQVSKSRVLKRWKAMDNAITDAANEAKDNVKYLYTLDKCARPPPF